MKKILKNLVAGFGSQLLIMAMSVILPRFILISFGSEMNGAATTITQIFSYIALLEAGIGAASLNRLYKDFAAADKGEISQTVSATQRYFSRIIPVYVACIIAFGVACPFFANTDVSAATIRQIILIQGISGVVNFYFSNTYSLLLLADGRNYVSSALSVLVKVISTTAQILLILAGFNIVSVQLSLLAAYIVKACILNFYVKRKYPWLQKHPQADLKRLAQRGSFVIHEISYAVFNGTDIFLISVFCSMKEASVYSIYNMVFVAVGTISAVLFNSIDFKLGTQYHNDREGYVKLHDTYEVLTSCFVFAVLSAVMMVILPFVRLYTSGVTDINYVQPVLPVLFAMVQLLSSSRLVSQKLITISGRATATLPNSVAETVINIVASVVLVNVMGMPGVLLGTVIALLYRTNDMIIYANVKILNRCPLNAYKTLLINGALFALMVLGASRFPLQATNYFQFFICGVLSLAATTAVYFGVHLVVNRNFRNFALGAIDSLKLRLKKRVKGN
jgi:O-antigen/teichoic acid export membrane protein